MSAMYHNISPAVSPYRRASQYRKIIRVGICFYSNMKKKQPNQAYMCPSRRAYTITTTNTNTTTTPAEKNEPQSCRNKLYYLPAGENENQYNQKPVFLFSSSSIFPLSSCLIAFPSFNIVSIFFNLKALAILL